MSASVLQLCSAEVSVLRFVSSDFSGNYIRVTANYLKIFFTESTIKFTAILNPKATAKKI